MQGCCTTEHCTCCTTWVWMGGDWVSKVLLKGVLLEGELLESLGRIYSLRRGSNIYIRNSR